MNYYINGLVAFTFLVISLMLYKVRANDYLQSMENLEINEIWNLLGGYPHFEMKALPLDALKRFNRRSEIHEAIGYFEGLRTEVRARAGSVSHPPICLSCVGPTGSQTMFRAGFNRSPL